MIPGPNETEWLTTTEVHDRLPAISEALVRQWVHRHKLDAHIINRRLHVEWAAVLDIERQTRQRLSH